MDFVRRIRIWALPFAAALGMFSLPFGTVTACDKVVEVNGFHLVSARVPEGEVVADPSDDDPGSTAQLLIAQRGGGLAVAALACGLLGLGLAFRRGRRAAVLATGAAAGGGLALWELFLRGREEADAFVAGRGLWFALAAFGVAGVAALASAVWRLRPSEVDPATALGCLAVAALGAGTILPFLHVGESSDQFGYSLVDFVSPGAGRAVLWFGVEAIVLIVASVVGVMSRRGGFLVGLGVASLAGHTAMIVELLLTQDEESGAYAFTLGAGLLLGGSLLLVLAGLALARRERSGRSPLGRYARFGLVCGAGLAVLAAFLPFDDGTATAERRVPLHLHDFPLPLAYGAAPFVVAALTAAVVLAFRRLSPVVTSFLVGLGLEALLVFLGPMYTTFMSRDDAMPGTGFFVGLAAGVLLLGSAIAAAVARRESAALR